MGHASRSLATTASAGPTTWSNARAYRQPQLRAARMALVSSRGPIVVATAPTVTPRPDPTPRRRHSAASPTPPPTPHPRRCPRRAPRCLCRCRRLAIPHRRAGADGAATSSAPRPAAADRVRRRAAPPGRVARRMLDGRRPGRLHHPPSEVPAAGSGGRPRPSGHARRAARRVRSPGFAWIRSVDVDLLAGIEVWSVPAATLGVPGHPAARWVALQAVGALAWIPAVKRLRGRGRGRAVGLARFDLVVPMGRAYRRLTGRSCAPAQVASRVGASLSTPSTRRELGH